MRPQQLARVYNHAARFYDRLRPIWVSRDGERALNTLVAERVTETSRILDLGAGTGANLRRIKTYARGFASYLGVDNSLGMLARAQDLNDRDSCVSWLATDAANGFRPGRSFDFIVSSWMLSHLEDPERVVQGALDALRPGGTAAFLFVSKPDSKMRERVTAWFMKAVCCARIDRNALASHPMIDFITAFDGGSSTLAVFRRPGNAGDSP